MASARLNARREGPVLDERKLEVLRAIVEDYVSTLRAGRVQGAGRPTQPRRVLGDDPQRHGGAGGRGLHHPAPHQRRPYPHRQGLSPLRRPAGHDQAAVAAPSGAPSRRSWRARSTSTTSWAARSGCSPSHAAGGGRAVPSLIRSSVRHVELVPLSPNRVMLVLITDTGRVDQRIVDARPRAPDAWSPSCAASSTSRLAGAAVGAAAGGRRDPGPVRRRGARRLRGHRVHAARDARRAARGAHGAGGHGQPQVRLGSSTSRAIRRSSRLSTSRSCSPAARRGATPDRARVAIGDEEHIVAGAVVTRQCRLRSRRGDLGAARGAWSDADGLPRNDGAVRAVARYVGKILAES